MAEPDGCFSDDSEVKAMTEFNLYDKVSANGMLGWLRCLWKRPEPERKPGKFSKRTESLLLAHSMARSLRKGALQ